VDIDDIDDQAARAPQFRARRLRQEQRRLHIGAHQVRPLGRRHLWPRCGIKARRVVDQQLQAAKAPDDVGNQPRCGFGLAQIGAEHCSGAAAPALELGGQGLRGGPGSIAVDGDICTRGVQMPYDFSADAPRAAGDQGGLGIEGGRGGFHRVSL